MKLKSIKSSAIKVGYLLNRAQGTNLQKIEAGEEHDNHLYGLLRLRKRGIQTEYVELEQYVPEKIATFIRNHVLNIYWMHILVFLKLFSYDIIFTSTAFGTQLLFTVISLVYKKSKWVMLDFSIMGLLGTGKTIKQKIFFFLVNHADGIVTIDQYEKDQLQKKFPRIKDTIEFMRFSVDTDFFKPQADVPEQREIFSPGRDPGRDFKTLFSAVSDGTIPVHITARPWNIKKLLPLPTYVQHQDLSLKAMITQYARASLVVIPLNLGNGINNAMGCSTIVEAMAMGKAIIATRTHTTESYIIHGQNGWLVPAHDPDALKVAIETLLSDDELRHTLSKNARLFAERNCSADQFAQKLADFFQKL